MMQMEFPFPVVLALAGAEYWPVTLALLIAALAGVAFTRSWLRAGSAAVALLLGLECAFAAWLHHVGQI